MAGLFPRKPHREGHRIIGAVCFHGTAMHLDDFVRNGKAESGASRVGFPRLIQPEKLLKEHLKLLRRDGFSVILKANFGKPAI